MQKKTYIIAEIGINHNGDLSIAKRLIDIASVAGCDAVKFQKRSPDICVPDHQKNIMRDTPWGRMRYIDYKHRVEFEKNEYDEIDTYCKQRGIAWSASPWDEESLEFLLQYDVPWIKLPSAMITNEKLVKKSAASGKKLIFSTGMSTYDEIDQVVNWISESGCSDFVMLHCNSSYPAPLEELNLQCIQTLKNRYGCEVGYSGHEFRLGTSVAAIYLGATIIERHITLDRSMWGTDQLCSVEPQGLMKLVSGIRDLEKSRGDGIKRVTEEEAIVRKKLRGY